MKTGSGRDLFARLRANPEWVLAPALLAILLSAWHFTTTRLAIPEFVLPSPAKVWHALVSGLAKSPTDPGGFLYHTAITASEALLGFLIGTFAGTVTGMCIAHFRLAERVLYPYIIALQSLPKIAVAPLFVIWFGFGMEPKVLIASVITFFPLLVNAIAGYQSVDPDRLDLARSCNATEWQIFWKIRLPSALPFIFAGLNMAGVLCILGAIVGEFVGAQAGLGVLILQNNYSMNIASTYAVFLILATMGLSMNLGMRALERRFCFWAQRARHAVEPDGG